MSHGANELQLHVKRISVACSSTIGLLLLPPYPPSVLVLKSEVSIVIHGTMCMHSSTFKCGNFPL